jgi:hypothetical protein
MTEKRRRVARGSVAGGWRPRWPVVGGVGGWCLVDFPITCTCKRENKDDDDYVVWLHVQKMGQKHVWQHWQGRIILLC